MGSKDGNKASLYQKLQHLRSATNSTAVNTASIVVDASRYIQELKERVEKLNQDVATLQTSTQQNSSLPAGCDASVLLDDTANFTGEKTAGPNANSLRGFDVIDTIKTQVERSCPGIVSCADILSVAARDGVVALNGPSWAVALGRRDSTTASLSGANSQLPGPNSNLNALITSFSNKGFTAREMVALSGSHTIGQARCTTFRNRIYNEANINASFAASVRANCPQSGGDNNLSPLDVASPNAFNNDYFRNLLSLRGLLHSDQQLFNNGSTDAQVRAYSTNSAAFFNDFASAMVKMSNLSPLTGTNGQIRRNCRRTN
ncbi:UNVERIFIED_CONTAM: Cationic peroxidase 1 [Sesamum radiatum]|uniref:Peroxidase n=1 Tax=Sesamum radiatum TaxID=300843 RepID=A0AAW2KT16_SESRA